LEAAIKELLKTVGLEKTMQIVSMHLIALKTSAEVAGENPNGEICFAQGNITIETGNVSNLSIH